MKVHHIAVVCQSEENADRFYRDLLGLERIRTFVVSAELSGGCFDFDQSYEARTYVRNGMTFEVFVVKNVPAIHLHLHHVGLEVEDHQGFIAKCREMGVEVRQVPKEDKMITMIKDYDGNLFEIKQKA
jgi:catechol 2,3-dioxygenase-like lactoylglutathione lyase family enzyme